MAKRRIRRKTKFTISAAIAGGFVPLIGDAASRMKTDGISGVGEAITRGLTGYSPLRKEWNWNFLKVGLFPIGAGIIVHKIASRLGVNRAIGRAGIPFIRI